MVSKEQVRAVAQAFADALDRNDFAAVAPMLAPTCRYDLTAAAFTAEGPLVGPEAILESYRWHDARGRNQFDRVEYSSVVESVDGMMAVFDDRYSGMPADERRVFSEKERKARQQDKLRDEWREESKLETPTARSWRLLI